MIEDWRREWGVGDFPFLFVQIANYKAGASSDWPTLRDQQLKTLALRNTGMAVTIDIGNPDNIHPTDKVDVGLRLALAARVITYGEKVEDSGPVFRQATPEGNSIRAWFDHAKNLTAKGGAVTSVEVAGIDGKWVAADARVDGSTVVANSPSVEAPRFIRYGWADSPQCNLFNGDGLPASPFNSIASKAMALQNLGQYGTAPYGGESENETDNRVESGQEKCAGAHGRKDLPLIG